MGKVEGSMGTSFPAHEAACGPGKINHTTSIKAVEALCRYRFRDTPYWQQRLIGPTQPGGG